MSYRDILSPSKISNNGYSQVLAFWMPPANFENYMRDNLPAYQLGNEPMPAPTPYTSDRMNK